MRIRVLLAPLVAALLLGGAGQALAQTSLDDPLDDRSAKRIERMEKVMRELRAIVFQGRETGQPVVVQPAETENQIATLTERMNDLEQTLTRLNGQLEVSNHGSDQARRDLAAVRAENEQLRAQVSALSQKVDQLASAPPPPPDEQAGGPAPSGGLDSEAAFSQARRLLLDGDYPAAERAFSDFVARFGDTPRGPEARFYLAKTLLTQRRYDDAAMNDLAALRGYPQTPWAPEAMVDLSRSLLAMKRPDDACGALGELTRRYPKANADVKARAATLRTQAKCGA